jgi:hypothetical protein
MMVLFYPTKTATTTAAIIPILLYDNSISEDYIINTSIIIIINKYFGKNKSPSAIIIVEYHA